MNSKQIDTILRGELGSTFLGVFARDKIPHHFPPRFAMVVNTDPAKRPGEHWVAFYVENGEGEYFDSYGLPPPRDLEIVLDRCCFHYAYNKYQLQDLWTFVCGQFCVYYLYHRNQGERLGSIVDRLRKYGEKNDCIVETFVAQKWGCTEKGEGQTCRCLGKRVKKNA